MRQIDLAVHGVSGIEIKHKGGNSHKWVELLFLDETGKQVLEINAWTSAGKEQPVVKVEPYAPG